MKYRISRGIYVSSKDERPLEALRQSCFAKAAENAQIKFIDGHHLDYPPLIHYDP